METTRTTTANTTFTATEQKQIVVKLLNSIESGDKQAAEYIDTENFKQHNLSAADGVEGFAQMMSEIKNYREPAKVNIIRTLCDKDYVVTHTEYNLFGQKYGFDIFRFENCKIVEHWDNLQPAPSQPNSSGRTMIDGATIVCDTHKTETNKNLVKAFVSDILIGNYPETLATYFKDGALIQHHHSAADGIVGFTDMLNTLDRNKITMQYTQMHMVLGEGNFILVVSEGLYGENGGVPTSFYDLFRIDNNKIAEHWDVIEAITPEEERKNKNGKF